MLNIAIVNKYDCSWMGGVNYINNLLYAISKEKELKVYFFTGTDTEECVLSAVEPFATVIKTSFLNRTSIYTRFLSLLDLYFGKTFFLRNLLDKYNINVITHSDILDKSGHFKTINWIPDLQHRVYPEYFSRLNYFLRDLKYKKLLKHSGGVVFSSVSAKKDAELFYSKINVEIFVLHFTSQIPALNDINNKSSDDRINSIINGEFYFLPNQFWKHKNHMVIFKAMKLLKEKGSDITVVCSGQLKDPRNIEYIHELQEFIKQNSLEDNLKLLGSIKYIDVFRLMKHSRAIVNPSFFEGWSSTVEEAKNMKKHLILSDISVHKEQAENNAKFFDPLNERQLVEVLEEGWNNEDFGDINEKNIERKFHDFGETYKKILTHIVSKNH